MADGNGCTCGAYGECECGCGADWTPQELIDARAEIARLRDELASATRHMEMAEAAWLRETAGNSPVAVTLTDAEREALEWAANAANNSWYAPTIAVTLRGLLERMK